MPVSPLAVCASSCWMRGEVVPVLLPQGSFQACFLLPWGSGDFMTLQTS